jgi:hypothetical protein
MPDTAALLTAVDRLAGRLRSLPQRTLRAGAAAQGLDLARWLSRRSQQLEFPGREPHEIPDDGVFAVGDQLAVAGHDLAAALATAPDSAPDSAPDGARQVLAEALDRVGRTAESIG